jgi:hypothetical protein
VAKVSVTGGAAALRITFLVLLALCGGFSSAAFAGGIDPVGTVTGALSTIASQTTVASDLTGQTTPVTSQTSGTSDATDAATGVVGTATGLVGTATSFVGTSSSGGATGLVGTATSGGGGGGTSSASGGSGGAQESSRSADTRRSSKQASTRTRFDRLPRRYEVLLERIESGHRVRASIARLRSLFATATPRMRARILHLLRSEIRRLERNGLTRRERRSVQRLHRLLVKLTAQPSPPSLAAAMSRPTFAATEITSTPAGRAAEVAGTEAAARPSGETGGPTLRIPGVPLPTPPPPSESVRWFSILLWALVIAAATMAAQQVIKDLKK